LPIIRCMCAPVV